jgi:hypothetical protein
MWAVAGVSLSIGFSLRLTARVSASGPLARPSELTFTLSRAVRGTARARPKVRKPLIRYGPLVSSNRMETAMRLLSGLVVCALGLGCTEAQKSQGPVVSDSTGIRIVEYPSGVSEGPVIRLDPDSAVRIGALDGEAPYTFSQVTGAVALEDGLIVVADGMARELKWFAPDGSHLRTAGRRGEGPGEFMFLGRMDRFQADTLAVVDRGRATISFFTSRGELAGSLRPGEVPESGPTTDGGFVVELPEVLGFFDNGDLLARGIIAWPDVPTGVRDDLIPLLRFDRARGEWILLGQVKGVEVFISREGGANDGMLLPFGLRRYVAPSDDWYVIGWGDEQGLSIHDRDGALRTWIRPNLPRLPITPLDIRREREESLASVDQAVRGLREGMWEILPVPDRMPAHGPVLVGRGEEIWVRAYAEDSEGTFTWHVFARSGEYQKAVKVPGTIELTYVGSERVVGIERDEYDVPTVVVFDRPPA